LTDSKGRPTGAIVGFLRSLGAYKKRFPGARVWVCWDGSSQRRKAMYPDYKANRTHSANAPSEEMSWLKSNLHLCGVFQAFNLKEEADDVIASLVRGPFENSSNIIVSTDRDMLQLVSEFTQQLCPNVGMSKEKLYNSDLVKEEYGVLPEFIVHIRALSGDSSDNIHGVPGFGLKTAGKLIKLYGTAPKLLASNLAGLGKPQMAKLREYEKRILENIELLTLKDVEYTQIESNPNQKGIEDLLKELEISDSIMAAFFPSNDRQCTLC
jgi:DNA polymerase-1